MECLPSSLREELDGTFPADGWCMHTCAFPEGAGRSRKVEKRRKDQSQICFILEGSGLIRQLTVRAHSLLWAPQGFPGNPLTSSRLLSVQFSDYKCKPSPSAELPPSPSQLPSDRHAPPRGLCAPWPSRSRSRPQQVHPASFTVPSLPACFQRLRKSPVKTAPPTYCGGPFITGDKTIDVSPDTYILDAAEVRGGRSGIYLRWGVRE